LRNNEDRSPYIWALAATTTLERYNVKNDEWFTTPAFTAITGFAAGAGATFVPSAGPSGLVAGSPTTTSFTLATLPFSASVGVNQLANRGDGTRGYRMRVMSNGAGNSGKTEEVLITANTSGTAPLVTFTPALTFTPTATDRYEIFSGRILVVGSGTLAATTVKAFDIAVETMSGNLTSTNLAATIGTDYTAVMLDETYVPSTRSPGDGFFGNLIATGSAGTTLTGTVAGLDSALATNEFRNFQVRIVTDAAIPTAVGQRRKITSHTAGPSPVYTVPTWTVTPSTTATFVIENNNDLLVWTNAATVTYSYAVGGFAADAAWSTAAVLGGASQYANPGTAMGAGCMAALAFGITLDTAKNARYSHIFRFRGAATTTLELFDIAAAATGTWTTLAAYGGLPNTTFTTGSCSVYDGSTMSGKYMYISANATQRFLRFDVLNRVLEPWGTLRFTQSTAVVGGKLAMSVFIDGATKVGILFLQRSNGTEMFSMILSR
jgi:hypothetical protein